MKNINSKRKTMAKSAIMALSVVIIAAVAVALAVAGVFGRVTAFASTEETSEIVKVFVGDIIRAPNDYAKDRFRYVDNLAAKNPSEKVTAVLGLDGYYTVDEVNKIISASNNVKVNRVYMWPEGETGRLSIYVENGNIADGIKSYMDKVNETGLDNDPQSIADYKRFLNGEYGIFALTITCPANVLNTLVLDNERLIYADIKYNVEAEQYAQRRGKTVNYIELPSKPDGAY